MTDEQFTEFREKFQSIVYYKGNIKSDRAYISTLYSYDKEGSHQKAIDKATTKWRETKSIFEEKLSGKTYEDWKKQSQELSAVRSRIKSGGALSKANAVERYKQIDISSFLCSQKNKSSIEETSTQQN